MDKRPCCLVLLSFFTAVFTFFVNKLTESVYPAPVFMKFQRRNTTSSVVISKTQSSADSIAMGNRTPETKTHFPGEDAIREQFVRNWIHVADSRGQIHLLSAFYDDRWSAAGSAAVVSLMCMFEIRRHRHDTFVYCLMTCDHRKEAVHFRLNVSEHILTGAGHIHGVHRIDGKPYIRKVVRCPLADSCHRPQLVSLSYAVHDIGRHNAVPVEYPDKDRRHLLGACVPVMFGCLDPVRVVEWLELHRLLGVGKVILYNDSVCADIANVLVPYMRDGYVDVIQNRAVQTVYNASGYPVTDRDEIKARAALLLNDCMYRHMYAFEYVVMVDLDEVIIPRTVYSLADLVTQIQKRKSGDSALFATASFTNFYFLLDGKLDPEYQDRSQPAFTAILRHRKRIGPSPWYKHMKSIVAPLACASVTNHLCVQTINDYKADVPRTFYRMTPNDTLDLGHNQHYRQDVCYLTVYGVRCRDGANGTVVYQDDAVLRYASKLKEIVRQKLETINIGIK